MKVSYVSVRYKKRVEFPREFLDQLPKRVALFVTIQLHDQLQAIQAQLEKSGITVVTVRPKHAWLEGQMLGCSTEEWSELHVLGFVYVGDGLFHPKAFLVKNSLPVHVYNPMTGEQRIMTSADIAQVLLARKTGLSAFLAAQRVGIIVTTKYGQNRMRQCKKLEERYPEKTFYYLLGDVIDFSKLQDFSFIEAFVNTACPRIMDDNEKLPRPIVNMDDLGIAW